MLRGVRIVKSILPDQGGVVCIEMVPIFANFFKCEVPVVHYQTIVEFCEKQFSDLAAVLVDRLFPDDFVERETFLWSAWHRMRVGGFLYIRSTGRSMNGTSISTNGGSLFDLKTVPGFSAYRTWVSEDEKTGLVGHSLLKKIEYEN